jgi:hypothetical protein
MDIPTVVQDLTTFLVPFLPYLLKAGEKAAEEAGKHIGTDAWERVKHPWARLHLKGRPTPRSGKPPRRWRTPPTTRRPPLCCVLNSRRSSPEMTHWLGRWPSFREGPIQRR